MLNGRFDPPCTFNVVVLDQDHVVQAHAVVFATTHGDSILVQEPMARNGFAGI
jgi:hypothetical protein